MKTLLFSVLALFAVSASAFDFSVGQGSSTQALTESTVGGVSGSIGNGIAGNATQADGSAGAIAGSSLGLGNSLTFSGATQTSSGSTLGGSLGSAGQLSGYNSFSGGAGQSSAGWGLTLP